jgi:hypothetical protein
MVWLVVGHLGASAAEAWLASRSLLGMVVGAMCASLCAEKAGARWLPDDAPLAAWARAVAPGLAAAAFVFLVAAAAAAVGGDGLSLGSPSLTVALGALRAVVRAVRSEALLTGGVVVLAGALALRGRVAVGALVTAAHAAEAVGRGPTAAGLALALATGALAASAHARGGLPGAVGAAAGLSWLLGLGLRGAVLDTSGAFVLQPLHRAAGGVAWAVAAAACLAAVALAVGGRTSHLGGHDATNAARRA